MWICSASELAPVDSFWDRCCEATVRPQWNVEFWRDRDLLTSRRHEARWFMMKSWFSKHFVGVKMTCWWINVSTSSCVVSLGMKISSKERTLGHCLGGLGSLDSPCVELLPDQVLACQAAISKCWKGEWPRCIFLHQLANTIASEATFVYLFRYQYFCSFA